MRPGIEDERSEHLHVVGTFAEYAAGRLSGESEGFGQEVLELFAGREASAKFGGLFGKFFRGKGKSPGFLGIDCGKDREQGFYISFMLGAKKKADYFVCNHLSIVLKLRSVDKSGNEF